MVNLYFKTIIYMIFLNKANLLGFDWAKLMTSISGMPSHFDGGVCVIHFQPIDLLFLQILLQYWLDLWLCNFASGLNKFILLCALKSSVFPKICSQPSVYKH